MRELYNYMTKGICALTSKLYTGECSGNNNYRDLNFLCAADVHIVFFWECINSGMDYWNGGMEFFKVQYHFLHPNKYNPSP